MKSIKNVFITSVTLAIALFASVQVTAMERKKIINTKIESAEAAQLQNDIKQLKKQLKSSKISPQTKEYVKAQIATKEEMLYGNEPYSMEEGMGVTHIKK